MRVRIFLVLAALASGCVSTLGAGRAQIERRRGLGPPRRRRSFGAAQTRPSCRENARSELREGRRIVIGLDGRKRTLASAAMIARGMAWSPDGSEVWFATPPDAQQVPTIYAVTLDGRQRRVMRSPGWPWLHDIARDGTLLLGVVSTQGGIIVESGGPGTESDLSWLDASILADVSTDGKHILFTESWEGVEYKVTAYMRGTDNSPAGASAKGSLSPSRRKKTWFWRSAPAPNGAS